MQLSPKHYLLIVCFLMIGPLAWSFVAPYGVGLDPLDTQRIHQLAIQGRDISVCDKIHLKGWGDGTDLELQSHCYRVYAKVIPEENVCPRLLKNSLSRGTVEGNTRFLDYVSCVTEQAKGAHDAHECWQIDDLDFRMSCVGEVAASKQDSGI